MKGLIISVVTLSVTVAAVILNTIALNRTIGELSETVEAFDVSGKDDELEEFKKIYASYKSAERFISITVSHDDLTNIENDLNEILGCIEVGDDDGAKIAKSRLEGSFKHLRRLSSLNLESII